MMDAPILGSGRPRWPLTLLTGMLGSGKTTLLRHALSEANMGGTVVLINEIGEIGIDHHLVERIDGETILLRGGCLCCAFRADLQQTLNVLRTRWLREDAFDMQRVIVETTGLADPDQILLLMATNPLIKDDFPLSRVVTTVDAQHALGQIEQRPEARRQIAVADQIILTKTDIASPEAAQAVEQRVRQLNPHAALARVIGGGMAARDWLFAAAAKPWADVCPRPLASHDLSEIGTLSLTAETPLDWRKTERGLAKLITEFAPALLRLKGILNIAASERPMVIHGVHNAFYPAEFLDRWPDADHRSRLVLVVDGLATCCDRMLDLLTSDGIAWQDAGGHRDPANPAQSSAPPGFSHQHERKG